MKVTRDEMSDAAYYGDANHWAVEAYVHSNMAKWEEGRAVTRYKDRDDRARLVATARVEWVLALEALLRWMRGEGTHE